MRAVVQRVTRAQATVEGEVIGRIDRGLLVLLAVGKNDREADVEYVASKIAAMRLFEDAAGTMHRGLRDAGGQVLVISQFTLYGDCRRGRRPSFDRAATAADARVRYEEVVAALRAAGLSVQTGMFQATMQVALVNDGPVTILLDSSRVF